MLDLFAERMGMMVGGKVSIILAKAASIIGTMSDFGDDAISLEDAYYCSDGQWEKIPQKEIVVERSAIVSVIFPSEEMIENIKRTAN